jgi:hypothetical protein
MKHLMQNIEILDEQVSFWEQKYAAMVEQKMELGVAV